MEETLLFDFLLARARVDVPRDSMRLSIAGRACGWAAADVPGLLAAHAADFEVVDGVMNCLPQLSCAPDWPLEAVNALLARFAATLSAAGRLNGWRGELLDVVDTDGRTLGVIERSAVRPLGIATHAVHLNAWTPDGDLWIAQRSLTKTTDPGRWDTLVGGLISAGETPEIALARESWEEAGLAPSLLAGSTRTGSFSVQRILPEGYQVENVTVVDKILPEHVLPENQDGEVAQIRRATLPDAMDMLADDAFTLEAALSLIMSLQVRGYVTDVDLSTLHG